MGMKSFYCQNCQQERYPKRKIYVEQKGEHLRYILQAPNGDKIDSILDIEIADFNKKTVMESKRRILWETEKRGHTLRDQDII